MGQNWWWVVLAVVLVVLFVALFALTRSRRNRDDDAASANAEIAEAETPAAVERAAARDDAAGAAPAPDGAAVNIPAPREEQPPSGPSAGSGESTPPGPPLPDPAGSALAALDSGLVGKGGSFAAAAAAVSAAAARPGPYPGSLLPAADGSSPSPDHPVKANEGSRRYHTPDSPFYVRTRGDAWFRTAAEARAAGFAGWDA